MSLTDSEFVLEVNGVRHWVRMAGVIHNTIPLVLVHGGPGGMVYTLEHTIGPKLESFCTVVYYEHLAGFLILQRHLAGLDRFGRSPLLA